jgi:hypothetical protein
MKKHTFKSASGNLRTSSRSGGSVKTGGTAKTLTKAGVAGGKYVTAVKKINGMSAAEFRQTLVRLGISNPDGKLTRKYTTKK